MLNPRDLVARLVGSPLEPITEDLRKIVEKAWKDRRHGLLNEWKVLLYSLPEIETCLANLTSDAVMIGHRDQLSKKQQQVIRDTLKALHPWRKGPFDIFGVEVDAEWRSNLKWSRLQGKITPLMNRLVLDVGCGNGYYMFRALGEGARFILGIDPSLLFLAQFHAVLNYVPGLPVVLLPLRSDEFPAVQMREKGIEFDSVFSMGVLYHRRDPVQHLLELARALRQGGELILETLIVINNNELLTLYPEGPYAKMPNIELIPSQGILNGWLEESGFGDIQVIDISRTTVGEQRSTEWMTFESLADFLDPDNPEKTIEGFPAPVRIIVTAKKL